MGVGNYSQEQTTALVWSRDVRWTLGGPCNIEAGSVKTQFIDVDGASPGRPLCEEISNVFCLNLIRRCLSQGSGQTQRSGRNGRAAVQVTEEIRSQTSSRSYAPPSVYCKMNNRQTHVDADQLHFAVIARCDACLSCRLMDRRTDGNWTLLHGAYCEMPLQARLTSLCGYCTPGAPDRNCYCDFIPLIGLSAAAMPWSWII